MPFLSPTPTGGVDIDWSRLLPRLTLYVHLAGDTVTRDHTGVARFETDGPVSTSQLRGFLGPHARFTLTPVIDLAHQPPADGYEIPDRLREAVHLRSPADVFPYATHTRRGKDLDHTQPYQHPDSGGPPGQTSTGNLGPLTRTHHRHKTHGGWHAKQPYPGIYIWRSPLGQYYLVDHTGTRKLGNEHRRTPTS